MSHELTTTGEGEVIVASQVLERVARLNKLVEYSGVALGVDIVRVKDHELYKELGYKDFKSYYLQELGRTKGDISKLESVGRFILSNGFSEETQVGYTNLYHAQSIFEGESPSYILAEAQTNRVAAMLANARDARLPKDHTHSWEAAFHCTDPDCGKYTTHQ